MPNFEIRLRNGERRIINGERVEVQPPLAEGSFRQVVVMRGAVVMGRFNADDVEGWDEVSPES